MFPVLPGKTFKIDVLLNGFMRNQNVIPGLPAVIFSKTRRVFAVRNGRFCFSATSFRRINFITIIKQPGGVNNQNQRRGSGRGISRKRPARPGIQTPGISSEITICSMMPMCGIFAIYPLTRVRAGGKLNFRQITDNCLEDSNTHDFKGDCIEDHTL